MLSDEERRRKYDQFGDTGDSQSAAGQGNPQGQGFTVFQSGNFFHFQFVPPGPQHHSDGVTEERFFNHLLPDSEVKPHLLYFYHDWCFQCAEIHHLWEEVKDVSVCGGGRDRGGCLCTCIDRSVLGGEGRESEGCKDREKVYMWEEVKGVSVCGEGEQRRVFIYMMYM